jgi:N-formylglutamate deformylase
MQTNINIEDQAFVKSIEDCELAPIYFDHQAHLRLAYLVLTEHGLEQGVKKIQSLIFNYVSANGARGKYRKDLTIAAAKLVNCFMRRSDSADFQGFLSEFPELLSNFPEMVKNFTTCSEFSDELELMRVAS